MIADRAALSVVLAAVGAAAVLGGPKIARPAVPLAGGDCGPPFADGTRQPDLTLLVATPRPDTLPAGDSEAGLPLFGQLAEAREVDGAAADRVQAALGTGGLVVLVPWGFDEDCRPMRWTGRWPWSPSGKEGFYRAELRRAEEWAGGHPTFDVYFAVWEGFPNSPWEHPLGAGQERISPEALFELYRRLPTPEEVAERPYGSVSDLVDWRRDAGAAADDYPSRMILAAAFERAESERIRSAPLPYAGTYRMRVVRGLDTLASFFLRTGAAGGSPWQMSATVIDRAPSAPTPAEFFAAAVYLAASAEALPSRAADDATGICSRSSGLHVRSEERADVEGVRRVWTAEIPVSVIAVCLAEDDVLRHLRESTGGGGGDWSPAFSGEFRQEEDGRYTFRQPTSLVDIGAAWLTGERIDASALP